MRMKIKIKTYIQIEKIAEVREISVKIKTSLKYSCYISLFLVNLSLYF